MTSPRCSFCGKSQDEVRKLIRASDAEVYICNECIDLCNEIIVEEIAETDEPSWWPWEPTKRPTTPA